jgi:hypothetical protein
MVAQPDCLVHCIGRVVQSELTSVFEELVDDLVVKRTVPSIKVGALACHYEIATQLTTCMLGSLGSNLDTIQCRAQWHEQRQRTRRLSSHLHAGLGDADASSSFIVSRLFERRHQDAD